MKMKPTIEINSYEDLQQYRKNLINDANKKRKIRVNPSYIAKNPLAPAIVTIGIAAAIYCIIIKIGFTAVFGCVCLSLMGVLCVFMPIFRAFLVSLLVFSFYPAVDILYKSIKQGNINHQDLLFILEYIPIIIVIIILYFISNIIKNKMKYKNVPSVFKRDYGLKFVDMIYSDIKPIKKYNTLVHIICNITEPKSLQVLTNSRNQMSKFAESNALLLCCTDLYLTSPQQINFYIYVPEEFNLKKLSDYLNSHYKSFDQENIQDPEWNMLYKIFPTELEVQQIYNEKMSQIIHRSGADTKTIRNIGYITCFSDKISAINCAEQANENGFNLYHDGNGDKPQKQMFSDGRTIYVLTLCIKSSIGIEKLNANTENILSFISQYGGWLNHWILLNNKK